MVWSGRSYGPALACITVFGTVAVGVLSYSLHLVSRHRSEVGTSSSQLDRTVAAYREHRLPWTASDLDSRVTLKDSDNAAPLILQAMASYDDDSLKRDSYVMADDVKRADYKAISGVLGPYETAMALAEQASKKKGADFHRDWDLGADLPFRELGALRNLNRAFCFRALAESAKGNLQNCLGDLETAGRLSDLAGQTPTISGAAANLAGREMVFNTFCGCAGELYRTPSSIQALYQSLSKMTPTLDLNFTLKGDIYLEIADLRNFQRLGGLLGLEKTKEGIAGPAGGKLAAIQRGGVPSSRLAQAFLNRDLQCWIEYADLAKSDKGDLIKLCSDFDSFTDKRFEKKNVSDMYAMMMVPPLTSMANRLLHVEACKLTSQALLAAFVYRSKNGRFPTSVSEMPGMWLGPYDHQPLRLKSAEDSITIYCSGPDKMDHGGVAGNEMKGDVVASCTLKSGS